MVRVLVNWWAYTWGGLYSEVYGICSRAAYLVLILLSVQIFTSPLESSQSTSKVTLLQQFKMGRRRSKRKAPSKKKNDPLATQFNCPFCNHEKSCDVKM